MTPAGDGSQVRTPQASAWNIANALTLVRIALVPVLAWFLLHDGGRLTSYRLLAALVFVVATATDRLDGQIARAKDLVTDFGKVSDPIADKALMGMALVGLCLIDLLPWWVTVVVLVREVGITALRFLVIRHGVMAASRGGKLKTALQAVAILLYILPLSPFWHPLAVLVMALAVVATVATGLDYLVRAKTLRDTSPRTQLNRVRRASKVAEEAALESESQEVVAREVAAREVAREMGAREVAALEVAAREVAAREVAALEVARQAGATRMAAVQAAEPEDPAGNLAGDES